MHKADEERKQDQGQRGGKEELFMIVRHD
jgi:hypothetical protein